MVQTKIETVVIVFRFRAESSPAANSYDTPGLPTRVFLDERHTERFPWASRRRSIIQEQPQSPRRHPFGLASGAPLYHNANSDSGGRPGVLGKSGRRAG